MGALWNTLAFCSRIPTSTVCKENKHGKHAHTRTHLQAWARHVQVGAGHAPVHEGHAQVGAWRAQARSPLRSSPQTLLEIHSLVKLETFMDLEHGKKPIPVYSGYCW